MATMTARRARQAETKRTEEVKRELPKITQDLQKIIQAVDAAKEWASGPCRAGCNGDCLQCRAYKAYNSFKDLPDIMELIKETAWLWEEDTNGD